VRGDVATTCRRYTEKGRRRFRRAGGRALSVRELHRVAG